MFAVRDFDRGLFALDDVGRRGNLRITVARAEIRNLPADRLSDRMAD
jgi:hypothetical protein